MTEQLWAAFEREVFRPLEILYVRQAFQQMQQREAVLRETFLSGFMQLLQERPEESWEVLSLSLLYSSVLLGKPVIRVEALPDDGGEAQLAGNLSAEWLFPGWEQFRQELVELSKPERRYLRLANLDAFMNETVHMLIQAATPLLRYWLRDGAGEALRARKHAPELLVSFGEYGGKAEILSWELPYVRLGNVPETEPETPEDFAYRRFTGQSCHDLDMQGLSFRQAIFEGCRLEGCSFRNCDLRDAVFRKCRFFDCNFSESQVGGSLWVDDLFFQTGFSDLQEDAEQAEFFRPAEGIGCRFRKMHLSENTPISWQGSRVEQEG